MLSNDTGSLTLDNIDASNVEIVKSGSFEFGAGSASFENMMSAKREIERNLRQRYAKNQREVAMITWRTMSAYDLTRPQIEQVEEWVEETYGVRFSRIV